MVGYPECASHAGSCHLIDLTVEYCVVFLACPLPHLHFHPFLRAYELWRGNLARSWHLYLGWRDRAVVICRGFFCNWVSVRTCACMCMMLVSSTDERWRSRVVAVVVYCPTCGLAKWTVWPSFRKSLFNRPHRFPYSAFVWPSLLDRHCYKQIFWCVCAEPSMKRTIWTICN